MTFSDGQYLYFPLFSVLENLRFNLLKVKHCSAQLNLLETVLVTEVTTLMINTSHTQAVVALDCPLKINVCWRVFGLVGFFTEISPQFIMSDKLTSLYLTVGCVYHIVR